MSRLIIHHFENVYAICEREDKSTIQIPRYKLPLETKEGDTVLYIDGFYKKDNGQFEKKKISLKSIMNSLFD